jgi:CBS domain-containing protein
MLVRDAMSSDPSACSSTDTLEQATRILWEMDVGCVPVVNEEGTPVAMLTDRDICMAAYTSGKPIHMLHVQSAMSRGVFSCKDSDSVAQAEHIMRNWQVRRLPVVDARDQLVGVLSLNDIVRSRTASKVGRVKERVVGDVVDTLNAICRHTQPRG